MVNISPIEATVLDLALPTGIISRRYIFCGNESETRRMRKAFSVLIDKGALREHVVARNVLSCRDITRYYLTPLGYRLLLGTLPADHPLHDCANNYTVRNALSPERLARLVRQSDAQTILAGAGVNDIYHTVSAGVFPHVLDGSIDYDIKRLSTTVDNGSTNYIDNITLQTLMYAQHNLTHTLTTATSPIFLPSAIAFGNTRNGSHAVGTVISTTTNTVYNILRPLTPQYMTGWGKIVRNDTPRYTHTKGIPIDSIGKSGKIALMLLDTTEALAKTIELLPDASYAPYTTIIPIVCQEAHPLGMPFLRRVLGGTYALFRDDAKPLILRSYPHLTPILMGDMTYRYTTATNDCYLDGTIVDLVKIKYYMDAISKPGSTHRYNKIKWICYDDQYDFYRQISGTDDILTISRY